MSENFQNLDKGKDLLKQKDLASKGFFQMFNQFTPKKEWEINGCKKQLSSNADLMNTIAPMSPKIEYKETKGLNTSVMSLVRREKFGVEPKLITTNGEPINKAEVSYVYTKTKNGKVTKEEVSADKVVKEILPEFRSKLFESNIAKGQTSVDIIKNKEEIEKDNVDNILQNI